MREYIYIAIYQDGIYKKYAVRPKILLGENYTIDDVINIFKKNIKKIMQFIVQYVNELEEVYVMYIKYDYLISDIPEHGVHKELTEKLIELLINYKDSD